MALNAPVLLWLMRGLDGFLKHDRELFGLIPVATTPKGDSQS